MTPCRRWAKWCWCNANISGVWPFGTSRANGGVRSAKWNCITSSAWLSIIPIDVSDLPSPIPDLSFVFCGNVLIRGAGIVLNLQRLKRLNKLPGETTRAPPRHFGFQIRTRPKLSGCGGAEFRVLQFRQDLWSIENDSGNGCGHRKHVLAG